MCNCNSTCESRREARAARPKKFDPLYKEAMSGNNHKAAITMFCLECRGFLPPEVFNCVCDSCNFYDHRPRNEADLQPTL